MPTLRCCSTITIKEKKLLKEFILIFRNHILDWLIGNLIAGLPGEMTGDHPPPPKKQKKPELKIWLLLVIIGLIWMLEVFLCLGMCSFHAACFTWNLLLAHICFSIVPETLSRTSQMPRLCICNSKLARSNVITVFVIPRFEFHNEYETRRKMSLTSL